MKLYSIVINSDDRRLRHFESDDKAIDVYHRWKKMFWKKYVDSLPSWGLAYWMATNNPICWIVCFESEKGVISPKPGQVIFRD